MPDHRFCLIAFLPIALLAGCKKNSGGNITNTITTNKIEDTYTYLVPGQTTNLNANGELNLAACWGNKIILAGDYNRRTGYPTSTMEIFDTATQTWTAGTGGGHYYGAAVADSNWLIFAGGYNTQYQTSAVTDMYNVKTGQWSDPGLSVPRTNLSATAVAGIAAFAGGTNLGRSAAVDFFDAKTQTWWTDQLDTPRFDIAAASAGNKMVFAGGNAAAGASAAVDIYDITTKQWTYTRLSRPRTQIMGASVGTRIFFAGGYDKSSLYSNAFDSYDTQTGQWYTDTLPAPAIYTCAVTAGNLVLFGGAAGHIDIYNAATGEWSTRVTEAPGALLAAVSFGNQVLFVSFYDTGSTQQPATIQWYTVQ